MKNNDRRKKILVSIDLEKAYNKVPKDLIWWVLDKGVDPRGYIDISKDMYEGGVTNARTMEGQVSFQLP